MMRGDSLAPGLLIAMPSLDEPPFKRAVILMLEHDHQGALGLVLNCELTLDCAPIAEQFQVSWESQSQEKARLGGPVQTNSLWLLHDDRWAFAETVRICRGVAVSRSREALATLCEAGEERLRLFLGYSGWGGEQIIDELRQGSWLAARADAELVFETPIEALWEESLRALGIEGSALVEGALDPN